MTAPVPAAEPPGQPELLDLYKLAVEMADRVSARRGTANTFFLSAQTALVAVICLGWPKLERSPWWIMMAVASAGIALCLAWWLLLRSYRDLNTAKFNVINELETQLPVKLFTDEWKQLKAVEDKETPSVKAWRGRYSELGFSERTIPLIFAGVYGFVLVGKLLQ